MEHEYGEPTFFFLQPEDDPLDCIAAHLKVLFRNAVEASHRPTSKRFAEYVISRFPKEIEFKLMDERNSVGIALGHVSLANVSTVVRKLGDIVDTTGEMTKFGFSERDIKYVCDKDAMAALAFATSRSGYIRELGLSRIQFLGPEIGFAIIVLRLNDWVPEVRAAAVKAIKRLTKKDRGPLKQLAFMIAGSISLLIDERRLSRMSNSEKNVVTSLVNYPNVKEAIRWILVNGESDRAANLNLNAVIQSGLYDEVLPEVAMKARCSHRRIIATRAILEGKHVWKYERVVRVPEIALRDYRSQIVRSALEDRSANVALVAICYLIESNELEHLDEHTIGLLKERREKSLQRKTTLLLDMIGK